MTWDLQCKRGGWGVWGGGKERGHGRALAALLCLFFVTRRRAAVESGPELLRVVGSRALLPRGQQ